MRGIACPEDTPLPERTYAALTRFLRTTRRFAEARFLAYAAARRSSSSNSRSFAEILRLLLFGWRDILASLMSPKPLTGREKTLLPGLVTHPENRAAK
jgi:hypothetical protein